ncbi:hypothetical protein WR25_13122 [Diploscapter pachys]|uniref:Domain of unknown function DB domain-containing protein n=1 Tax=Diploscapter pachys TaxID=2018661 RepID=A0A2A2LPS9_9BILA|nr:hypothetical protein WR25_13122 [Diploscapter pachys]
MRACLSWTVFFILLIESFGELQYSVLNKIAKSCCGDSRACCLDTIMFNKSLNCSFGFHRLRHAAKCLQEKLYGATDTEKLQILDIKCCHVFMEDENDQEDICLRTCMEVMKRPSFDAAQKNEMVKKCALINPLYGCFSRCIDKSRKGHNTGKLFFDDYCQRSHLRKRQYDD